MKNKKLVKIFNIIFIICFMMILPLNIFGCAPKNKTKAIIIIPGITGSNLYDANTNKLVWPRLSNISNLPSLIVSNDFKEFVDLDGKNGAYGWIDKLSINKDGTKNHDLKTILIDTLDSKKDVIRYGANNTYQELYLFLEENFKKQYDVKLFEYDWRFNNIVSAKALQQYIDSHGYKEVVLIGHSMGGLVASNYMALSNLNMQKVKKFIPIGTPFLGAEQTIAVAEDPLSFFGLSEQNMQMFKNLVEQVNGVGSFDILKEKFKTFVNNVPTLYELLPTKQMSDAYIKQNSDLVGHGIIDNNGIKIIDYQQFLDFIKTRSWVNNLHLDNLQNLNKNVYNNNVHISLSVDTSFIVGNNKPTCVEVCYDNNQNINNTFYSNSGDGTVPLYSAVCGLDASDSRVCQFKNFSHIDIVKNSESLQKIKEIIKNIKTK